MLVLRSLLFVYLLFRVGYFSRWLIRYRDFLYVGLLSSLLFTTALVLRGFPVSLFATPRLLFFALAHSVQACGDGAARRQLPFEL